MRIALAATFVLLPLFAVAGEPKVTAPISREDVQHICALIARAANETVNAIEAVTSEESVPGVTPEDVLHISAKGERKLILEYPRRDRVLVRTNCKGGLGYMYDLQKSGDQWKVLRKDRLVE